MTLIKALTLLFASLFIQSTKAAPLTVATDENLPPYSYVQWNVAAGIDVDMLRLASAKLKIDLRITALPWKRALLSLEKGEAQLAMPLFKTPEREGFAVFAAPVHYSATGLFVKRGNEFKFDSASDLAGKRLGYNRGYALPNELEQAIRDRKLVAEEVNTTSQNIAKLMLGRIDVFAANTINTQYLVKNSEERGNIVQLPKLLSQRRPAYLVVSKAAEFPNKSALIVALTTELDRLHRDGTYDEIVKRYTQ